MGGQVGRVGHAHMSYYARARVIPDHLVCPIDYPSMPLSISHSMPGFCWRDIGHKALCPISVSSSVCSQFEIPFGPLVCTKGLVIFPIWGIKGQRERVSSRSRFDSASWVNLGPLDITDHLELGGWVVVFGVVNAKGLTQGIRPYALCQLSQ